jgi:hypothetical protein
LLLVAIMSLRRRTPSRSRDITVLIATAVLLAASGCGGDDQPGGGVAGTASDGGAGGSEDGGNAPGGAGQGGEGEGGVWSDGYAQVFGDGTAVEGTSHLAMAPDGAVYVTWVDDHHIVFVARSTEGGATFGGPEPVHADVVTASTSGGRHPYIVVDDERVAVAFRDDAVPTPNIHLYASSTQGPLIFDQHTTMGNELGMLSRDHPMATFLPDGSLVVAFYGDHTAGAGIFVAREAEMFVSELASAGAPGTPSACTPLAIAADAAGGLMIAYRNDEADVREMWLARAPTEAFETWVALSDTEGAIPACPSQGPRLAAVGPARHLAIWSGRGAQNGRLVTWSASDDGGASWSGGEAIADFAGDEPSAAMAPSGRLYVAAHTGNGTSAMVMSEDGGMSWSAPERLISPDGDMAMAQANHGGGVAAVSATSAGNVWLRRLE